MEATYGASAERGEARPKLETAVERAAALCQRRKGQTAAAAKAAERAVREHPYPAIGSRSVGVCLSAFLRCGAGATEIEPVSAFAEGR